MVCACSQHQTMTRFVDLYKLTKLAISPQSLIQSSSLSGEHGYYSSNKMKKLIVVTETYR